MSKVRYHYTFKKWENAIEQYEVIHNGMNITVGKIYLDSKKTEYFYEPEEFNSFKGNELQEICNFIQSKNAKLYKVDLKAFKRLEAEV